MAAGPALKRMLHCEIREVERNCLKVVTHRLSIKGGSPNEPVYTYKPGSLINNMCYPE
jgi:hypothetical protein